MNDKNLNAILLHFNLGSTIKIPACGFFSGKHNTSKYNATFDQVASAAVANAIRRIQMI